MSRPRTSARASSRLATFARAISSTKPTVPSRISSGVRTLPVTNSCTGTAERAAEHRADRQRLEQVGRDERGPHSLGLLPAGQIGFRLVNAGHALERGRVVAVAGHFRVRQPRGGIGLPRVPDDYHAFGIAVRQRPDQHGLDQAEDGRIRADAERECDYRDGREGRLGGQAPKDVAKILNHVA